MRQIHGHSSTSIHDDDSNLQGAPIERGLRMLLRQLDMPVSEAEWKGLGPTPEDQRDVAAYGRLVERLGLELHAKKPTNRAIRHGETPFLILGHNPDDIWLVRGRTENKLVLVSVANNRTDIRSYPQIRQQANRMIRLTVAKAGNTGPGWKGVMRRHIRPILWQVGLASVVINILALATPLFMMTVYNKVVNHGALATLDVMAIGMLSLLAFELILRSLRGSIAARTGARLDAAIGSEVVHHLLALPTRVLEKTPSGQLMERIRQLDQLRQFLAGQLPLLMVDLAFVGLFVAAIFILSPIMGWITLATLPLFALVSVIAHRKQRELMRKSFVEGSAKAAALGEIAGQSFTIKALGVEGEMEQRFDRRLVSSAWCGYRASSLGNIVGSLGLSLQHGAALLLIYVGARLIVEGQLSIGALIACSILAARAIAPMRQLFGMWHQLEQTRHAFKRLQSLMDEATESGHGRKAAGDIEVQGRIAFRRVSYRYNTQGDKALDDITFEVEPGTMLGVTGLPGSGKSTLIRLLVGLDKADEGSVEIDGFEIGQLEPVNYRQQIGVVPQEIELFRGSIADNIAMGSNDRSIARIVAAAKFVGAHDFIQRLPDGYDTELAERGAGLSLGQRQLISIARALVRNPRILILDEATSALDQASENELLANLRRAGRGRTIVFVSHKANVLKACDRVLHLEHGHLKSMDLPHQRLANTHASSRGMPAPANS